MKESQFGNLSIESGEIYKPLSTKENMFTETSTNSSKLVISVVSDNRKEIGWKLSCSNVTTVVIRNITKCK